jgi:hypothetical protein
MTLSECSDETLINRYINMVDFHNKLVDKSHWLESQVAKHLSDVQKCISKKCKHITLMKTYKELDHKALVSLCGMISSKLYKVCEYLQPLLRLARQYNKLTFCPTCNTKVKIKLRCSETCHCYVCGNHKTLRVVKYGE